MGDIFSYDGFVGSGVGTTPESNEDRFYDPDGITEPEIDEMEEW